MAWHCITGIVAKGHRVASGQGRDARYPEGTLALQRGFFEAGGLDLGWYYVGTLNLSIAPLSFAALKPKRTFRQVAWSRYIPPEDFSFFDCRILTPAGERLDGLVYYPHPETKPEHFQDPHTLEILAPFIAGLRYGSELTIWLDDEQITVAG